MTIPAGRPSTATSAPATAHATRRTRPSGHWRALLLCALAAAPYGAALAQDTPQYGGTLTTSTVNPTVSVLTWDRYDWNWKHSQDDGQIYDQLFVADLTKAKHLGGKHSFTIDAWLPSDAIRGELAESWQWQEDPLRLTVKLRRGVMFPDKPGVMKARELTAEDVVYTLNRIEQSPKKVPTYFDHLQKVQATDSHTVVFTFKNYLAEWDYRFGYGYFSAIFPKEVVDAGMGNWRNHNGTGPFMLTDFVQSTSNTYERNPNYWDSIKLGDKDYKLPFVDKIVYRTIKDESTLHAAFRTGKVDVLEVVRFSAIEEMVKRNPQIKTSRWLNPRGTFLSLRVDQKPFDDVRVRRALNMAINKQEVIQSYYLGNAELFAYPQHPDFEGYFEPLDKMPDSVKELFVYSPDKARKLLAEAGYPKGFSFKIQYCTCNPTHAEMLPLLTAYLEKINVKAELVPTEYAAYLSALTGKKHEAGFMLDSGHTNPTTTLRKSFVTGQTYNPSMYSDPDYDRRVNLAMTERDEARRQQMVRDLTKEILDKAPYVWMPTAYAYTAWWPWVKNYGGELRAGAERPGPIYARIWIDQALKKKMGF